MAQLFHIFPLLFPVTAKKRKAGERRERERKRVTSHVSPRNTAKLCIRSKERNLRRFALFSLPAIFFLCVFNFCALAYIYTYNTGRETRRSLILPYDCMIIYPAFFFSHGRPFIRGFSATGPSLMLYSTTAKKTPRRRINDTLFM